MNISQTRNCYGCGMCAIACAKQIIRIGQNAGGFYEPSITNYDECTNCGLCVDVCAYNHDELSLTNPHIISYAAWSKDYAVRRKCSSGGVGFEIGKLIIEQGGKVCGVRFNAEKNQAEHYVAETNQELIPSIGSKYIQSYTVDGFNNIIKQLRQAKKQGENPTYLVTGTPCQIDSFRRYIQKFRIEDNFILLDFFCHGVPSKLMWDKYVSHMEKKVGKLTYVSWRNKFTGWHDSWAMAMDGEEKGEPVDWHESYNLLIREKKSYLNSRLSQGDLFYKLFLGDFCTNKACRIKCRYKYDKSSADIRIGDAWGKIYKDNEDGVSAVIAFTNKGAELLKTSYCELIEHSFEDIAEGQMKKRSTQAYSACLFKLFLKTDKPLDSIEVKFIIAIDYLLDLPRRVYKKVQRMIRK